MKTFLPVLLMLFGNTVWAQSGELWFSGGASVLLNRGIGSPSSDGQPHDVRLGEDFRVGFRFAFNSAGRIGHEIQYAYNRTNLLDDTGAVLRDAGRTRLALHQGRS